MQIGENDDPPPNQPQRQDLPQGTTVPWSVDKGKENGCAQLKGDPPADERVSLLSDQDREGWDARPTPCPTAHSAELLRPGHLLLEVHQKYSAQDDPWPPVAEETNPGGH